MTSPADRFQWLKKPWVILAGLCLGVAMGLFLPDLSATLAPGGTLYLSLLKMCVIPIMVTAVITSIGRLLMRSGSGVLLRRTLTVMVLFMFIASATGVLSAMVFQPGTNMSEQAQAVIGRFLTSAGNPSTTMAQADIIITRNAEIDTRPKIIVDFLMEMVPTNVFRSLSHGSSLQILFFSIVLGMAVGLLPNQAKSRFLDDCDVVFQAFVKVIQSLMYLLPFGLALLIANQVLALGVDLLFAMGWYVLSVYVGCLLLFLIGTGVIAVRSGSSFWQAIKALEQPLIIALSSRNSFAAMPSAITGMTKDYRFDSTTTNLIIPLGVTMFRFGGLLAFAVSGIFFAQLYGLHLGLTEYLLVLFTAVFAGVASAGAPTLVTAPLLSIILDPLGLPSEAAVVLYIAINPMVAPVLALLSTHGQCTATALVAPLEPACRE